MRSGFHPEALQEFLAAARHYRTVDAKLAVGFVSEMENVLEEI